MYVSCGIYVRSDQGLYGLSNMAGPSQEYREPSNVVSSQFSPHFNFFFILLFAGGPLGRVSEVDHTA